MKIKEIGSMGHVSLAPLFNPPMLELQGLCKGIYKIMVHGDNWQMQGSTLGVCHPQDQL